MRASPAFSESQADTAWLFARWHTDADVGARDELIRRFLPLARQLAWRYTGALEPFDDLMQVASLALVKAMDRYDPERGTAFTSFAVPTIVGEIKRYFRDFCWSVHVPRTCQDRALKVEQAQKQLTTQTGRTPSVQQLAEYVELSIEDVIDALQAARGHHSQSLDARRVDSDFESLTLGRTDERFDLIDASVTLNWATKRLTRTQRSVLALRFNEHMTQKQIADQIGVSQMQVCRILNRSLDRLRELTANDGGYLVPVGVEGPLLAE